MAGFMVLAALLAALSLSGAAAVNSPQDASITFTVTTTTNYPLMGGGNLKVNFNSVQLDTGSPQNFAFGVLATASPGSSITSLHWDFGDGSTLYVPYCCENQVSEVQYHIYALAGTYNVLVIAYDNGGNFGEALVTVTWPSPIPEFPATSMPLLASILMIITTVAISRTKRFKHVNSLELT
jgi:PKD repeat protein